MFCWHSLRQRHIITRYRLQYEYNTCSGCFVCDFASPVDLNFITDTNQLLRHTLDSKCSKFYQVIKWVVLQLTVRRNEWKQLSVQFFLMEGGWIVSTPSRGETSRACARGWCLVSECRFFSLHYKPALNFPAKPLVGHQTCTNSVHWSRVCSVHRLWGVSIKPRKAKLWFFWLPFEPRIALVSCKISCIRFQLRNLLWQSE